MFFCAVQVCPWTFIYPAFCTAISDAVTETRTRANYTASRSAFMCTVTRLTKVTEAPLWRNVKVTRGVGKGERGQKWVSFPLWFPFTTSKSHARTDGKIALVWKRPKSFNIPIEI